MMTVGSDNSIYGADYDREEVVAKYQNQLSDLEKLAKTQGNLLNLSIIYIVTNCAQSEAPAICQYLEESGFRILTEDVEPDNDSSPEAVKTTSAPAGQVNPFNPSQIDIKRSSLTIDLILKRIKHNELDFNSDFQRKAGLWSNKQKSQLIESMILNIPLPAFYFDASDNNKWVIIDGLQRLTAIKEFAFDKTMQLSDMEFLTDLNEKTFDELPRSLQRRIEETEITAFIVNPATPPNVKYNIFKRINTGGLVLEPQEIRNALFYGPSTRYLRELAACNAFVSATGGSIRSERMQDREFCLRYVAFTALPLDKYKDLDEWLNRSMLFLNKLDDEKFHEIYKKFQNVMKYAQDLFGRHAFRKMSNYDDRRRPINKALFEDWSYLFSLMDDSMRQHLLSQNEEFKMAFRNLCDSYDFQSNLRSSDPSSVARRISQLNTLLYKFGVLIPCVTLPKST